MSTWTTYKILTMIPKASLRARRVSFRQQAEAQVLQVPVAMRPMSVALIMQNVLPETLSEKRFSKAQLPRRVIDMALWMAASIHD
jgi:hypothetical protein